MLVRQARDLKPRIISGLLLAVAGAGHHLRGVMPFAGLVIAIAVAMSWEWGRVVRDQQLDPAFAVHAGRVASATLLAALGYAALGLVLVMIGAILVLLLQFGRQGSFPGRVSPTSACRRCRCFGSAPMSRFDLPRCCSSCSWYARRIRSLISEAVASEAPGCGAHITNKTWAGFISGIAGRPDRRFVRIFVEGTRPRAWH